MTFVPINWGCEYLSTNPAPGSHPARESASKGCREPWSKLELRLPNLGVCSGALEVSVFFGTVEKQFFFFCLRGLEIRHLKSREPAVWDHRFRLRSVSSGWHTSYFADTSFGLSCKEPQASESLDVHLSACNGSLP